MLSYQEFILRLLLSALLGGLVGLERERLDWAAGLRTHMLVCIGSTIVMLTSAYGFADVLGHPGVVLDPARIAAQVVSGIGFLGAGTIIFRRKAIRGLTTAAGLWAVAAVGLAIGGGLYGIAISSTLLVLVILMFIKPIERKLFINRRPRNLMLSISRLEISVLTVQAAIEECGLQIENIKIKPDNSSSKESLEITFNATENKKLAALIDKLRTIEGINEINSSKI